MTVRRFVVATAGHVDHGKSTLVRALTGIEPDRYAEERRRGLTLDLGFAWTVLPSGAQLAFVDVPGHERFIGTMLTGLGAAPAVLFVVAADEGWSRQSSEHLAAIDALDVRHGLLAITRSDLADPAQAEQQARERIAESSLGDTEIESVPLSARTGAGLPQLRAALDRLVARLPTEDASAPVRLWLDRSFTMTGAGTVVTGTLTSGSVGVGDTFELHDRPVTVRGAQSGNVIEQRIAPTARVALNLRGVSADDVRRGDVLLTPDRWHRSAVVDARLSRSADELPAELVLHAGTAAVAVRVRPLGGAHARLTLDRALPLRAGDRAVLRDPGRHAVAGGVLVLDADPPPLERRGAARSRAVELADRSETPDVRTEVARRGVVRRDHLERLGIDTADLTDVDGWLVAPETRASWMAAAPRIVAAWAGTHRLDPPMPVAAFAQALAAPTPLAEMIAAEAGLQLAGGRVSDPSTRHADLGAAQAGVDSVVDRLRRHPFRAPEAGELAELGLGRRELAAAARTGVLLVLDGVILLPDAPEAAREVLVAIPAPFTLSEARQALDTTRRVAVPLLERLDELGMTEPTNDGRRVVVPPAESG